MPEPVESKKPVEKNKSLKKAPVSRYSQPLAVKQETDAAKAQARLKVARANYKDYTDTLIGLHASNNYFVVYSKFFIYVYAAKKARLVKVKKLTVPIVQIEVIENNATILQYGLELEVITRDRDLKEDEEVDREYLVVYYLAVVDPEKCRIDEEEAIGLYTPSAEPLECHSCVRLTRSKKKLFTCTEIDDNVVECFRNRPVRKNKTTKNVWRYFTKFKCMSLMNNNFKANDDKIKFLMPDILLYLTDRMSKIVSIADLMFVGCPKITLKKNYYRSFLVTMIFFVLAVPAMLLKYCKPLCFLRFIRSCSHYFLKKTSKLLLSPSILNLNHDELVE